MTTQHTGSESMSATHAALSVATIEWIIALKERRLAEIERLTTELAGIVGGAQ
jgi:hypothetical protein